MTNPNDAAYGHAAALKAALAPEKIKIRVLAEYVRLAPKPTMTTEQGGKVLADVLAKAESFAQWIEKQAETLG